MKNRIVFLSLMVLVLLPLQSVALMAQDSQVGHGAPEPPKAGVQWARGEAPPTGQATSSPNLIGHGGPIMTDAAVTPIFWGPSWGNANFVGDKIDGLTSFYGGIGGSAYIGTNTEYFSSNGSVTRNVTYNGYVLDLSPAAKNANVTSPILAEVCKSITSPVPNGYYPVYVDNPRGHAGFCAWHSAGTCNGTPVQFAFFFNLDGDAGCDPGGSYGSYQSGHTNSQGLGSLANVSGHELSEAVTDPRLNAWYDSSGQENSDKCAWVFPHASLSFTNSSTWKIQPNWSNAAYNAQTGYVNRSGQKGCIDGN